MFRDFKGKTVRVFGESASNIHRVSGKWVKTSPLSFEQESWLNSVNKISRSLPGWPIVDGIDLSKYNPDRNQLLPMDKLSTPWCGFIELSKEYERTRILVADEGGIGKTLSVSIALRWVSLQSVSEGPILVLVPPLLVEHWTEHLKAVFSDDPEKVIELKSAKYFDPRINKNDIIVTSKYSWIHHFQDKEIDFTPSCVVIDEAHQGRTGMGFNDLSKNDFYEEEIGLMQNKDERDGNENHAEVIQRLCSSSKYAIAVTATPINTKTEELDYILSNICSEQSEVITSKQVDTDLTEWSNALFEIKNWAKDAQLSDESCPNNLVLELIDCIDKKMYPEQWNQFEEIDIARIKSWLENMIIQSEINPALALTLVNEFHPYGRHLSMTLRNDLLKGQLEQEHKFRSRIEQRIELSFGQDEIDFFNSLEHNGKNVGTESNLGGPTRIITSHKCNMIVRTDDGELRYGGNWTDGSVTNTEYLNELRKNKPTDVRVNLLADMIRKDVEMSLHNHQIKYQRGLVIFTEFVGTGYWIAEDLKHLNKSGGLGKIKLSIHQLTGGTQFNDARTILNKCRTKSFRKEYFPILICTPAGEVGIDMEWASTLCHWDLNSNPQRMEQRTWRLDRRIKNKRTMPSYRIIYPILLDSAHYPNLESTINQRFSRANKNLCIGDRFYIPTQVEEREIKPAGSNYTPQFMNPEISKVADFLESKQSNNWPGPRLSGSERIRAHLLFDLINFEHADNDFLSSGRALNYDPVGGRITIGDIVHKSCRDLEEISQPVSRALSPTVPYAQGSHSISTMWDFNKRDIIIPSLSRVMPKLFFEVNDSEQNNNALTVSIQSNTHSGRYCLCLNKDLLTLAEKYGLSLNNKGLRLYCRESEKFLELEDDKYDWGFAQSAITKVVTGEFEFQTQDIIEMPEDKIGRKFIDSMIAKFSLRNENKKSKILALNGKAKDVEDELERKRSEAKIVKLNSERTLINLLINELKNVNFRLETLCEIEVNM